MEYALRLEEPAELAGLPEDPRAACVCAVRDLLPPGELAALYFGSEFCQERLPGPRAATAFCAAARNEGLEPTLLTPPVTAAGLERLRELLEGLEDRGHLPAVVFNDWGTLRLLSELFPRHPRRAGRLLNRTLRDPRAEPAPESDDGRATGARLRAFLAGQGAAALETDPDLVGAYLGDGAEGLQRTLHLPFAFAASGRHCLVKAEAAPGGAAFASGLAVTCGRPCRAGPRPVRRSDTDRPLWRAGNTLFYESSAAAARSHLSRADRVVLHRRPSP